MPLPSYYPSADQITSVTTYEYDDAHNRVARVRGGVTASYSYNNLNQMTGYTEGGAGVSYTYDANGNRATRQSAAGTDTYGYDYENRLVAVSKGGVSHAYTYDYRTRRVERVEGGTAVKVVFSGGTSVQEYAGASVQAEYVRGSDYGGGIGGLLYSLRAGVPSYTHYNNRGDVVAKTGTSGAVTWQATYEAFGKRPAESGTTPDRQKANTKEEDPTGLLNEGFRYRDLETGEFITRDPAGFVDGPNLYAYVRQNPWTHFDPEGLRTHDEIRDDIKKRLKENEISEKRQKEINTARDARGGNRTEAEDAEYFKLAGKKASNIVRNLEDCIQACHLEASAQAIAYVTKENVAHVLGRLDDRSEDFRDGLTLARAGRVAGMAASYYGGKVLGWGLDKVVGRIMGSFANRAAKEAAQRAFWIGRDAEAAGLEKGYQFMTPTKSAVAAMNEGDMSLMRAESAANARRARGNVPVVVDQPSMAIGTQPMLGDTFFHNELPELIHSVNLGDVTIRYEFMK